MAAHTFARDSTLYVDGSILKISDKHCYKAETQCVLFLAAYCGQLNLDLVLVSDHQGSVEDVDFGIRIPKQSFKKVYRKEEKVLPYVSACKLPAVCTLDQINIYSGLCTVLRYLVKRAANFADPLKKNELLSLLGHRLYCLKSCSEVSPRTKLCELHMPSMVNTSLPNNTDATHRGIEIPKALVLFEELMNRPVVIHNMDKRQRVLLERLERKSDLAMPKGAKRQKRVVWTKDLPQLEHIFAEGVDFTLTDICVYPCVDLFIKCSESLTAELNEIIPRTVKWYNRVNSIPTLKNAVSRCGILSDLVSVTDPGNVNRKEVGTEILELASDKYIGRNSTKKKDIEMTLRRDLPGVLAKLHSNGIGTDFTRLNYDEIAIDWPSMPKELHPTEGELGTLRASRKCQQIENLTAAVKSIAKDEDTIVDFCSGGGHVGIVLAYLLPNCKIILVENKEESLDRARTRIYSLHLKNIAIYQCNLEYFRGSFDIGVALHACGVATDMVVQSCIAKNASFVISPCCYGKVQNCHWISYPQSLLYKNIPISFEESLLLGHAADKTSWNFESKHAIEGKMCMGLVDLDRANAAKEHGYLVNLYTMQPTNCTPKNNMLVGVAPSVPI